MERHERKFWNDCFAASLSGLITVQNSINDADITKSASLIANASLEQLRNKIKGYEDLRKFWMDCYVASLSGVIVQRKLQRSGCNYVARIASLMADSSVKQLSKSLDENENTQPQQP